MGYIPRSYPSHSRKQEASITYLTEGQILCRGRRDFVNRLPIVTLLEMTSDRTSLLIALANGHDRILIPCLLLLRTQPLRVSTSECGLLLHDTGFPLLFWNIYYFFL